MLLDLSLATRNLRSLRLYVGVPINFKASYTLAYLKVQEALGFAADISPKLRTVKAPRANRVLLLFYAAFLRG